MSDSEKNEPVTQNFPEQESPADPKPEDHWPEDILAVGDDSKEYPVEVRYDDDLSADATVPDEKPKTL